MLSVFPRISRAPKTGSLRPGRKFCCVDSAAMWALLCSSRAARVVSGRFPTVSSLTVLRGWTAQRGVLIHLNGKQKKKKASSTDYARSRPHPRRQRRVMDLSFADCFDKHPILARKLANLRPQEVRPKRKQTSCAHRRSLVIAHHPQHPCFRWPALAISLDDANRHL